MSNCTWPKYQCPSFALLPNTITPMVAVYGLYTLLLRGIGWQGSKIKARKWHIYTRRNSLSKPAGSSSFAQHTTNAFWHTPFTALGFATEFSRAKERQRVFQQCLNCSALGSLTKSRRCWFTVARRREKGLPQGAKCISEWVCLAKRQPLLGCSSLGEESTFATESCTALL